MKRMLVAGLAIWAMGCSCGEKTRANKPSLEVLTDDGSSMRTSVDFGFVQVNVKGVQKVRVRNGGNATLTISEFAVSPSVFGLDNTLPLSIEPGQEDLLAVTFTPTVPDQRITGTLDLSSNDQSQAKYTLQLAGQGVTAVAKPSPTTLAFGDVYAGETKPLTLTLTNGGGNALPVMGATISGSPLGVTGDFTALTNAMIPPGDSASVTVTFAPMAPVVGAGTISGSVVIAIDQNFGGNVTVPITGRAVQALPRLCFKFDDTGVETCTDQVTTSLNVPFGALCDNALYTCAGSSGARTGKLYFRNEGNVPVPWSATYKPYIYPGARCDGGSTTSDFAFSNVPVPDGGLPLPVNMATSSLPANEMAPRPWETSPITVSYRATSHCREDGTDQAQIIWTRQDPVTTMPMRTPSTLFATLTGTSSLPSAKPKPINIGQAGQPYELPQPNPIPVELVTNEGAAPLTLTSVELWEELPAYLADGGTYDGGGPQGGILTMCTPVSSGNVFSDCSRFQWSGMLNLPVTLDGGATPSMPSQAVVGHLNVGCLPDGGSCPSAITRYHVYAIVNTSDPYAPRVVVPIVAYVRAL